MKKCPFCGWSISVCAECLKEYPMGTASHCTEEACKAKNAPVECINCSRVVSPDLDGVLGLSMYLRAWDG